jgi:hypothetical protein
MFAFLAGIVLLANRPVLQPAEKPLALVTAVTSV